MKQLRLLAALFATALALHGCRCGGGITPGQAGFRVDPQSVEFGRVLEGTTAMQTVAVIATGTATVDVDIAITGMGFTGPTSLSVPGGGQANLTINFGASNLEVTGSALITQHGGDTPVTVPLHAVGVRPKVCTPSAPCKVSSYDLQSDQCIEGDAPEQSQCTPNSLCLENGRCHLGVCEGTTRSCDDGNKCTDDSCSEQVGCVNTPHVCPSPGELCKVATCDPSSGCGKGNAMDLTPCGGVSCTNAALCFQGSCQNVPPPEGFQCSPETPCQGAGHCHSGDCELPDASVMTPTFTLPLGGTPMPSRPALLAFNGNLYFVLCGIPIPPGDGGVSDGGDDAGLDGGTDGGADGGPDGGPPDAGPLFGCVLESYTSNGFERWAAWLDGGTAALANVSASGALVLEPGGSDLVAIGSGSTTWFEVTAAPSGTAATKLAADLLLTPPSLSIVSDGGLSSQALGTGATVLAIDESDTRWLWEPDGGTLTSLAPDGGLTVRTLMSGAPTLATGQGVVLAGYNSLLLRDGGTVQLNWSDQLGNPYELLRPLMVGQDTVTVFDKECDVTGLASCTDDQKLIIAHSHSVDDGGFVYASVVTGAGTYGRVEETAQLDPFGFAAVVQSEVDGGPYTYLELFAFGSRGLVCPLPDRMQLGGALFNGNNLWLIDSLDGGAWRLESYDLKNLPLSTSAWPVTDGVSGQRRAR
ncbi:MAG: hypothetical protein QM723_22845 [Myxococcaceae bacterium]